jgi:hypothetical protein
MVYVLYLEAKIARAADCTGLHTTCPQVPGTIGNVSAAQSAQPCRGKLANTTQHKSSHSRS